ncbi:Interleukin-6 receptor subunit beta [Dissostichus eleginoides]|uniref:Interleukin-6 receptor subunit beta n=1 Tax=Dissostichus eleginoides TaxID=100907 RepID=A0AAD9C5G3_DISEL|nr:Interleukin-6 receptor subunit beta [Dissostichus eleginoides]
MERPRAMLWTCLLGAGLTLALPPAFSVTPPEAHPHAPRLLRCVFLNRASVTCHWEAGDNHTTQYTLQVQLFTCITPNTHCTAALENTEVRNCFCISITAHSPKHNITSRPRCQPGRNEVMLPPAKLTSTKPDTLYNIRLRHRFRGPESPWSPWSNTCLGRTGEDAPSAAPAFWRQPLPHSLANGRVLFYNVTCQTEGSHVLNDHGSCRDLHLTSTSCSLLLPAGRCSCALTASTSAGASSEARIWFSGASDTDPAAPSQFTVSPLNDSGLGVLWTAPVNWSMNGFVLEWFAVREKNSSVLHWELLSPSCTQWVITEGVKPMECYAVSVRALYGERGAGQNRTARVYTRQGAPSAGPKVSVQKISGSKVDLTWIPVPVELLHGFIRNFTIFYITPDHSTERVTVPGQALGYTLEDLSPGNYDVFMQANTDAGAGAAGPKARVNIGSEEVSIVLCAVLPLILTSLALLLMACLAQSKKVKQKLCRDIPNPSKSSLARWSPKINLESIKQPTMAEKAEILYSEVILLDECELQSPDTDQDLDYQKSLQTYFCHRNSSLPVSRALIPENNRKSENDCIKSPTRARTTADTDISSIYANVVFPETLQSVPSPLTSPTYLQSNTWQHSSVSVTDVKRQLGGDCEPPGHSTQAPFFSKSV